MVASLHVAICIDLPTGSLESERNCRGSEAKHEAFSCSLMGQPAGNLRSRNQNSCMRTLLELTWAAWIDLLELQGLLPVIRRSHCAHMCCEADVDNLVWVLERGLNISWADKQNPPAAAIAPEVASCHTASSHTYIYIYIHKERD